MNFRSGELSFPQLDPLSVVAVGVGRGWHAFLADPFQEPTVGDAFVADNVENERDNLFAFAIVASSSRLLVGFTVQIQKYLKAFVANVVLVRHAEGPFVCLQQHIVVADLHRA